MIVIDGHNFKLNFLQVPLLSKEPSRSATIARLQPPIVEYRISSSKTSTIYAARVLATCVPITDAPQTHYGNESADLGRSIPLTTLFAYKEFIVNVCSNPKPYTYWKHYV